MSLLVEGQKCPVCRAYLFDNDDLVFCPDCGAPHHRDCYAAIGRCAYFEKHGTPEGYKKPEPVIKVEPFIDDGGSTGYEKTYSPRLTRNCPRCDAEIPEGKNVCTNCGAPAVMNGFTPFGTPIVLDPLGGLAPDEKFDDDVTAKDVKDFTASNSQRYVSRFWRITTTKKTSWNWAAFLFPHAWYFYRKMYLPGILFFTLMTIASLFSMSYITVIDTFPDEALKNYATIYSYMLSNMQSINMTPIFISLAGLAGEIIIRVISGLFGDKIYLKHTLENVKKVKQNHDDSLPLKLALAHKGNVNMILGVVGLFALQWITTLLYTLI